MKIGLFALSCVLVFDFAAGKKVKKSKEYKKIKGYPGGDSPNSSEEPQRPNLDTFSAQPSPDPSPSPSNSPTVSIKGKRNQPEQPFNFPLFSEKDQANLKLPPESRELFSPPRSPYSPSQDLNQKKLKIDLSDPLPRSYTSQRLSSGNLGHAAPLPHNLPSMSRPAKLPPLVRPDPKMLEKEENSNCVVYIAHGEKNEGYIVGKVRENSGNLVKQTICATHSGNVRVDRTIRTACCRSFKKNMHIKLAEKRVPGYNNLFKVSFKDIEAAIQRSKDLVRHQCNDGFLERNNVYSFTCGPSPYNRNQ
eukprot:TRINITY_DN5164_c0_g7_i1.p1 TRINITY_DN5164_c0_g7~~TRINITY_DN5164_c0_g7_i1.p1  ORF type:complete len:305 (-),score=-2.34 TRINITY_DN5164_c0_g7_i1:86-1000(-)